MNVPIEEKKKEAIFRMKKLGIYKPIVKQFQDENMVSESAPPMGACFWIEGEQLERIREFEKKHNALVYHVIHSYSDFGEMESYLYVSDYKSEWNADHEDLAYGQQLAYVYNHDMPDCSEFGSIGIKLTAAAGLKRVW